MATPTPIPITLARIDTPKTWTPQELELLNKNFSLIQEVIKQIIVKLPP